MTKNREKRYERTAKSNSNETRYTQSKNLQDPF